MKRILISMVSLGAAASMAWAQHGHVVGAGGHGAPPSFSNASSAATGSGAKNTGASASASAGSMAASHTAGARVSANPAVAARVQPLLPAGMTLQMAATGFRNQGQFLAALHAAHNLNIPFTSLKADMTGTSHDSLGQAIHALRPSLSSQAVKSDVKTADRQARADLHARAVTSAMIASRISANPTLSSRVTALLPSGMTLRAAAAGFRSEGQFLAALHVAHDLNIPFQSLQAQVASGQSLGQAVATLRPNLSATMIQSDVHAARQEAQADLTSSV